MGTRKIELIALFRSVWVDDFGSFQVTGLERFHWLFEQHTHLRHLEFFPHGWRGTKGSNMEAWMAPF